jgi:microcystin degradation protein MlrC
VPARAVGIEPRRRRVIAVKSSVHFRAAFEPLAAAVLEVETPGLSGSDLAALPYRRVRRPIVPLDRRVRYLD